MSGNRKCDYIFFDGKNCPNLISNGIENENRKYCFWHIQKDHKRILDNEEISKSISLREAYLEKANIIGKSGDYISFDGKDLSDSNFEGAKIKNASFKCSNLKNANFRGAIFENVSFFGADISDAVFSDSILINVDFKRTKFGRAVFNNAVFKDVQIDNALCEENEAKNENNPKRKVAYYKKAMALYSQFEKAFRPYNIRQADSSWKKYQKVKTRLHRLQIPLENNFCRKVEHCFLLVERGIFGLTSGYGENPLAVLVSSLAIIGIFGFVFSVIQGFSWLSFLIATEAFVNTDIIHTSVERGWLLLENVVGYIMMALFVVTLTRKLFK